MIPIKQDVIARLYAQYNGHATSFSGLYDSTAGSITVGFDDNTSISTNFSYRSVDGNHQGTFEDFMRVISQAAATAIVEHVAQHSSRQPFIDSVASGGSILSSIIDSLQKLFYGQRLSVTGAYDGLHGVINVYFNSGEIYHVNFTYIGDVLSAFIEICRRAIAYAVSLNNVQEPLSLYSEVTGDVPAKQMEFTVDLPAQNLWSTYTLYSEVYKDI